MRSDRINNMLTAVLAACALVITAVALQRGLVHPASEAKPPTRYVADWQRYADSGEVLGATTAPVTIVEFSDFQCPFCRRFEQALANVRAHNPTEISVRFRNFPLLTLHPHAMTAAVAAECAGRQGRFAAYHDALFAHQDSIGHKSWGAFARMAGVPDKAVFWRCLHDSLTIDAIKRDMAAGAELGVSGTPTILINGNRIDGAPSQQMLEALVEAAEEKRLR